MIAFATLIGLFVGMFVAFLIQELADRDESKPPIATGGFCFLWGVLCMFLGILIGHYVR